MGLLNLIRFIAVYCHSIFNNSSADLSAVSQKDFQFETNAIFISGNKIYLESEHARRFGNAENLL